MIISLPKRILKKEIYGKTQPQFPGGYCQCPSGTAHAVCEALRRFQFERIGISRDPDTTEAASSLTAFVPLRDSYQTAGKIGGKETGSQRLQSSLFHGV